MAIELLPLPLPASADASKFNDFGREVKGVSPGTLSEEELEQVKEALYKVSDMQLLRLRDLSMPRSPSTTFSCSATPTSPLSSSMPSLRYVDEVRSGRP